MHQKREGSGQHEVWHLHNCYFTSMNIRSKFPQQQTTIFTVMSALAQQHQAINLSQGFPNFHPDPLLLQHLNEALQEGYNQYAPMAGHLGLRQLLATKHQKAYGCTLDAEREITITSGATQALYTAITALVHLGDEVVIFEPAYGCYLPAIEAAGGRVVPIRLKAPHFYIDWQEVKECINAKTRMILVNTPNNPACTTWNEADWQQLESLVAGKDIVVLSDEVYEHLVLGGRKHLSLLGRPALKDQGLAVFSFGKTFHVTGWKMGHIAGSHSLMAEFRKLHQYVVFAANHPMQEALFRYMAEERVYSGLDAFFDQKYQLFVEACSDSGLRFLPSHGSYFVLADYSDWSDLDDREFAHWLTVSHGVASIPLSPFYSADMHQKLVRFCFAKTEDLLLEAAGRLQKVKK